MDPFGPDIIGKPGFNSCLFDAVIFRDCIDQENEIHFLGNRPSFFMSKRILADCRVQAIVSNAAGGRFTGNTRIQP